MTKLVIKSDEQCGGEETASPPPSRRSFPLTKRQIGIAALASLALVVAIGRLLWLAPFAQEWRLSRQPLPILLRERGQHTDDPRLLYYVGLRLNQQGRFAEAETNLHMAVGLDLESVRLRDEWARALLGSGRVSDAFAELQEFAGTHPNSAQAHWLLGKFYVTQQTDPHAETELERAVALDPNNADAWAYLSMTMDHLGLNDRSLDAARQAVKHAPSNSRFHLLLASLLERRALPEAGDEYRKAIGLAPRSAPAHQQYAAWLNTHGGTSGQIEAEKEARQAIALDAQNAPAILLLGQILHATGRDQDAIPLLTQAAALDPDDIAAPVALAQAEQAVGQQEDAKKWRAIATERTQNAQALVELSKKLRASPNNPVLHRQMARLMARNGDVNGCLSHESSALRRPVDSLPVLIAAVRDLMVWERTDLALPLAQQAVALSPHGPDSHEGLGDVLLHQGQLDAAIGQYNYTTTYTPDRAPAIQARVNRYTATHRVHLSPAAVLYRQAKALMEAQIGLSRIPPHAEELAEKSVALDPGDDQSLRLLLQIQFGEKKTGPAIVTARKLLDLVPDDAATHALLGIMLVDQARTPADFAEIEQQLAQANTPQTQAQRHYGLGLLALRRRQGAEALTELKAAQAIDPGPDVTYYKISQAAQLAGRPTEAAAALAEYQRRQKARLTEFTLQSDISHHPDQAAPYQALARFYDQAGRTHDASEIRAVMAHELHQDHSQSSKEH